MQKEWLHAGAPMVPATLHLGGDGVARKELQLEVRANFVLVDAVEAPASSWTALHPGLRQLQLREFVLLKSVHPAMLLGCPLRATPTDESRSRGKALDRYLREGSYGALVACCSVTSTVREFYVVTSSVADGSNDLLMYRVASAEEILLPDPDLAEREDVNEAKADTTLIDRELESLKQFPVQVFNAFRNRSGALDATLAVPRDATTAYEPSRTLSTKTGTAASAPRSSFTSPLAIRSTATTNAVAGKKKKKRRLL